MIQDIDKKELTEMCVDLLMKTYTSLDQKPTEETVFANSILLANDLKRRYGKLSWEAIELAFYNGVRDTDLFHIQAKTWCKWIGTMKQQINEGIYDMENNNLYKIGKEIKQIINKQKLLK
tara:strand:- start:10184 stop:10543 length:360 start_codon:yes stop_codon:yes gene_type:complete